MPGVRASPPDLISVVIAAYNAQHCLRATLDSLLAQTWANTEIIVVDDGSTDRTPDLLASYAPRVHTLRQPNGGLAAARRAGVAAARGRYVALMDADDLCRPERLAVQARVLARWPEVVLCCSDFDAFDEHGQVSTAYASRYYTALRQHAQGIRSLLPNTETVDLAGCLPPAEAAQDPPDQQAVVYRGEAYHTLVHGNFVHPPTIMFRHSVLAAVGSFEPEAGSMCDWDWVTRAARAGQVAFVERALLDYRLSATQMSAPRHRLRASADTLRVAERICRRDAALYAAERPRFRAELGFYCADAADAQIDHDRGRAARLLARSLLRFGYVNALTLRVLAKLLTPGWALTARRQRKSLSSA
jgi:glycosyltransferase involved in cell wall biosynthesis